MESQKPSTLKRTGSTKKSSNAAKNTITAEDTLATLKLPVTTKPKIYIILPASTTGDLWHLASAAILNAEYKSQGNPDGLHIIPVIWIDSRATKLGAIRERSDDNVKKELMKQFVNGSVTFNFLKDLGLDCVAIAVDISYALEKRKIAPEDSNAHINGLLWNQQDTFFDTKFQSQSNRVNYKQRSFMQTIADEPPMKTDASNNSISAPIPGRRSLHYHSGTTAAMMTLIDLPWDPTGRREKLKFLSDRLTHAPDGSGGIKPIDRSVTDRQTFEMNSRDIIGQATAKFDAFMGLVKTKREQGKKVIIYNNRGNSVNSHTNSKPALFTWFRKHVHDKFLVIDINTGGDELDTGAEFDLFNKRRPKPKVDADLDDLSPGIDPLVTCRFFKMLAEEGAKKDSTLFGMFSGRSGSIDIAAFCGVNCFYWDTPFLNLATFDPKVCNSYGFDANQLKDHEYKSVYVACRLRRQTEEDREAAAKAKPKENVRTAVKAWAEKHVQTVDKAKTGEHEQAVAEEKAEEHKQALPTEEAANAPIGGTPLSRKSSKKDKLSAEDKLAKDAEQARRRAQFEQEYRSGRTPPLDADGLTEWNKLKGEAEKQMTQTYRTLQQCLIMAVGYPTTKEQGKQGEVPWDKIEPEPFNTWLSGVSPLDQELKPSMPATLAGIVGPVENVLENEASIKQWLFWTNVSKGKMPVNLPNDDVALYKAAGTDTTIEGGKKWAITLVRHVFESHATTTTTTTTTTMSVEGHKDSQLGVSSQIGESSNAKKSSNSNSNN